MVARDRDLDRTAHRLLALDLREISLAVLAIGRWLAQRTARRRRVERRQLDFAGEKPHGAIERVDPVNRNAFDQRRLLG